MKNPTITALAKQFYKTASEGFCTSQTGWVTSIRRYHRIVIDFHNVDDEQACYSALIKLWNATKKP